MGLPLIQILKYQLKVSWTIQILHLGQLELVTFSRKFIYFDFRPKSCGTQYRSKDVARKKHNNSKNYVSHIKDWQTCRRKDALTVRRSDGQTYQFKDFSCTWEKWDKNGNSRIQLLLWFLTFLNFLLKLVLTDPFQTDKISCRHQSL